ncbi:MAG: hypothetical protein ABIE70_05535 [bacterium]
MLVQRDGGLLLIVVCQDRSTVDIDCLYEYSRDMPYGRACFLGKADEVEPKFHLIDVEPDSVSDCGIKTIRPYPENIVPDCGFGGRY